VTIAKEPLLKEKDQHGVNYFILAHFILKTLVIFLNKKIYINEEVNCTEPSLRSVFSAMTIKIVFALGR